MRIFVAVVSHNHQDMIMANSELANIAQLPNVEVIVKDNVSNEELSSFCKQHSWHYISSPNPVGFGHNNNDIFGYCGSIGATSSDWFIVMNPDVILDADNFRLLAAELSVAKHRFYTIDMYKDLEFTTPENSLRHFPNRRDFLFKLITNKPVTQSYDKSLLSDKAEVEWASGAFLIFRFDLFEQLSGFDTSYHMYYEDVDICFRSRTTLGENLRFLSGVKAVHEGAYKNRNPFSIHFWWYLKSLFRFVLSN